MERAEGQLTDEAKFVRWFVWGGVAAIVLLSIGRLVTIVNYLSWPESSGIYEGTKTVSSGRSGGAISCARRYLVDARTDLDAPPTGHAPVAVQVDSPCLVLVGPMPSVGERVPLRVHPKSPDAALSSTEAFGLGIFELFAIFVAAGARFVRRAMVRRGSWFRVRT